MNNKLHVGNLSYSLTEKELSEVFAEYGTVNSAVIIKDRATGRSKGFGFVEFSNDTEAAAAVEGLNEAEVNGRTMFVSIAKERTERPEGARRFNNDRGGDRKRY